jgi:hypothetical protein
MCDNLPLSIGFYWLHPDQFLAYRWIEVTVKADRGGEGIETLITMLSAQQTSLLIISGARAQRPQVPRHSYAKMAVLKHATRACDNRYGAIGYFFHIVFLD